MEYQGTRLHFHDHLGVLSGKLGVGVRLGFRPCNGDHQ
jgi:hypothetical protein